MDDRVTEVAEVDSSSKTSLYLIETNIAIKLNLNGQVVFVFFKWAMKYGNNVVLLP